jgi:hypothetical protein
MIERPFNAHTTGLKGKKSLFLVRPESVMDIGHRINLGLSRPVVVERLYSGSEEVHIAST